MPSRPSWWVLVGARRNHRRLGSARVCRERGAGLGRGLDAVACSVVLRHTYRLPPIGQPVLPPPTCCCAPPAVLRLPFQSAQRLMEERDALQQRLDQVALEHTMGAALAETQASGCGAGRVARRGAKLVRRARLRALVAAPQLTCRALPCLLGCRAEAQGRGGRV